MSGLTSGYYGLNGCDGIKGIIVFIFIFFKNKLGFLELINVAYISG